MKIQTMLRRTTALVAAAAIGSAALTAALTTAGCKSGGTAGTAGATRPAAAKVRQAHQVPAGQPVKLAFVTNNSSEYWKVAESGLRKFEKEAGVKVDVKVPQKGTVAEQNQIVEDLLAQNYSGIAISPIAPADQTDLLNKAAAQTNLITQDSDAADSNRLLYVGTDNFDAGRALGAKIVELMPAGGKIAVFVGTFSADNARQRLLGVEDAIKGKNITVAAKKEDNKDQGRARSNVNDVLTSMPDVTMMVGLWSYNGPQIAAAIEQNNKQGKVMAAVFDDEVDTLTAIERGTVNATVVQKQYEFAYQAVKRLYEVATGGQAKLPEKDVEATGVEIIVKDNLAAFRERKQKMMAGS